MAGERRRERSTAAASAYRYLNARLGWDYPPGSRVPVDDVARALGVSRQPVREAVRRLEIEGLVTIVPRAGCTVVEPERHAVRDLIALIAAADAMFLPLVAEHATRDDRMRIGHALDDVERLCATSDRGVDDAEVARLGIVEYYAGLYGIATTKAVTSAVSGFRSRSMLLAKLQLSKVPPSAATGSVRERYGRFFGETVGSLRALSDAIEAGDAARTAELARARILAIGSRLSRAIGSATEGT